MTHQRRGGQQAGERQDVEPDRQRLDDGLQLAAAAGRDHAVPDHPEAQHGDADLADQDHHGHPPRQQLEDRQADQRGAGERLVGDRVGELAELGDLAGPAGDHPVVAVGDDRQGEDQRSPSTRPASSSPVVLQQQDGEDRDDGQPQHGQRVRQVDQLAPTTAAWRPGPGRRRSRGHRPAGATAGHQRAGRAGRRPRCPRRRRPGAARRTASVGHARPPSSCRRRRGPGGRRGRARRPAPRWRRGPR